MRLLKPTRLAVFVTTVFAILSGTLVAEEHKRAIVFREVAPFEARIGQTVTAKGENLGADRVKELYLTNGDVDIRVEVVEQNNAEIRFKMPDSTQPGKYRVAIVNEEGVLLDQPVFVRVVDGIRPTGG